MNTSYLTGWDVLSARLPCRRSLLKLGTCFTSSFLQTGFGSLCRRCFFLASFQRMKLNYLVPFLTPFYLSSSGTIEKRALYHLCTCNRTITHGFAWCPLRGRWPAPLLTWHSFNILETIPCRLPAVSSADPRVTCVYLQEAPWTLEISRCHVQWVDCRMLIRHGWLHRQSECNLLRTVSKAVWVRTAKSSATKAASLAVIHWITGVAPLHLTLLAAWALKVPQKARWSAADQTPVSVRCPPPPRYHLDPKLRRYSNAAPP